MDLSTADLCDAFPGELEVCRADLRLFGARRSFRGAVATLSVHEDAGLVRRALGADGAGRVLVVDGGGSTRVAIFGDRLAALAARNGWAGVVVFGAVRDVEALSTTDLGVAALSVTPARGSLDGVGTEGTTFSVGGAVFAPDRHVVCDADGLVVSERPLTSTRS